MTDARDPMALLRYAAQVGDWRLVEGIVRLLQGPKEPATAAGRAYRSLALLLGLVAGSYDRP